MDIIRRAADPECSDNLVRSVEFVDAVLSIPPLRGALKALFGLRDLEHDEDFVSLLSVSAQCFFAGMWALMAGVVRGA